MPLQIPWKTIIICCVKGKLSLKYSFSLSASSALQHLNSFNCFLCKNQFTSFFLHLCFNVLKKSISDRYSAFNATLIILFKTTKNTVAVQINFINNELNKLAIGYNYISLIRFFIIPLLICLPYFCLASLRAYTQNAIRLPFNNPMTFR